MPAAFSPSFACPPIHCESKFCWDRYPVKAVADRDEERDRAGDPGHRASAAPGRHEELAPEVDDHEEEEQLRAPEMRAVHEMPDRRGVPPRRARRARSPRRRRGSRRTRRARGRRRRRPTRRRRRAACRAGACRAAAPPRRRRAHARSRWRLAGARSPLPLRAGTGARSRGRRRRSSDDHDEVRVRDQEPALVDVAGPAVEVDQRREDPDVEGQHAGGLFDPPRSRATAKARMLDTAYYLLAATSAHSGAIPAGDVIHHIQDVSQPGRA